MLLLWLLLHTLRVGCSYGCTISHGFTGWQGAGSRYPQGGLCWKGVWDGWYLYTGAFSTASALAAAYFVFFSSEGVGDGSSLSHMSWFRFPALDVLPASRSGFSEVESSITPLHHVLCCKIHLKPVRSLLVLADPFPD